jgi:hypothetical protein
VGRCVRKLLVLKYRVSVFGSQSVRNVGLGLQSRFLQQFVEMKCKNGTIIYNL